VLDLLSARHRAAPPLVSPLAGLGVEIRTVKVACLSKKTCTSPFWGAGGSACRAPTEQGMCGTSSALVIEQPLHLWVPWRAWGSKYGPVKTACLK
jgi:hypothetical protein